MLKLFMDNSSEPPLPNNPQPQGVQPAPLAGQVIEPPTVVSNGLPQPMVATENPNVSNRLQSVLILGFGLIFAVVSLIAYHISAIPMSYVRTTGIVGGVHTESTGITARHGGAMSSTPTVSFKARNGSEYSFVSHTSGAPKTYTVGQQVTVAYNPQNPSAEPKITDASSSEIVYFSYLFGGVGIVMVLAGVYMVVQGGRTRKNL